MARRKPFRNCVLKEMDEGFTKKEATMKCNRKIKKESKKK